MEVALYGDGGFFARGHGAGPAPGATSSPAPRSARCSARASARALDRLVARARASPTRSWWSRPAPGNGRLARDVLRAAPACLRRAALRARRAVGRAAGRAARRGSARAGRRGARPVRRGAPTRTQPVPGRRRGPGVHRARGAARARGSTASCSPTSCSTTCRSGSREWDGDALARGAGRRSTPTARSSRCSSAEPTTPTSAYAGRRAGDRACPIPRGLDEWWRGVRRRRCDAASCSSSTTRRRVAELGDAAAWLRTYRGARARPDPLDAPGEQDITADVVLEQLRRGRRAGSRASRDRPPGRVARARSASTTLVDRGPPASGRRARTSATSRRWPAAAASPRPRALTDPAGLGAHRVVLFARRAAPVDRDSAGSTSRRRGVTSLRGHGRDAVEALLQEGRTFPPPADFAKHALDHRRERLRRRRARLAGLLGPAGARARLVRSEWDTILEWELPFAKWFVGGKLNVVRTTASTATSTPATATRSRSTGRASPATRRAVTYARAARRDVAASPTRCSELGVAKGDRVAIYMGMVPETVAAMLACARIGAAHSVVFGGFTARVAAATASTTPRPRCSSPPTARGGAAASSPLKEIADEALAETPVDRAGRSCCGAPSQDVAMQAGRDVWWHDVVARPVAECAPESMDAEDLLFILYTSAPPGSPRASCTRPAATSRRSRTRTSTCSTCSPTPTSTGAPPTSAGSPATRTSSTDRSRTAPPSVLYEGTPDHPGQGPALVDRREVQGHDLLHRAHRDPDVHEVGRRATRARTTCRRCGCSAPSASRSTPRRGSGTGSTSAASAARSSTRGGRPRPARS